MLKVLKVIPFFAPAYGYGGPVIQSFNISKIQAALGYDVRVLTTNILNNDIISKELPKFEVMDGIKVHRYPIRYRLGQSHYLITPKLPKGFLKYDYDLIHSCSFRTFQTDMATLFSKLKKKPFVFTAQGTTRNITLFNWLVNKKKEANRIKYHDVFLKKFFINTVDRVIVHSKYEKFWTVKNGIPESKIRVIPAGVNIENFTNLTYRDNFIKKFRVESKMILYVGRLLRDYRDLAHLIKVMPGVLKEFKGVKLWLVGESYDKEYENDLKKLAKDLNLIEQVVFVTHPSREEILGAYQAANVILFPITNSDSFGIPLIEAGAAKTPIISPNRGPAAEIIKNGKTGILTKVDDLTDLKNGIVKILTDDELERKIGLEAYENVLQNYTWEKITERTNKVYEEII